MKTKLLITCLLVALASQGFAFASSELEIRAASLEIQSVYKDQVFKVNEDIYSYHWAGGVELGIKDADQFCSPNTGTGCYRKKIKSGILFNHFNSWTSGYLNPNFDHNKQYVGYGYYVATDPESSASYGSILTRLRIRKGLNFMDLRVDGVNGMSLPKLRITQTILAVCPNLTEDKSVLRESFDESKECLDAFQLALSDLHVAIIVYGWDLVGAGIKPAANVINASYFLADDIQQISFKKLNNELSLIKNENLKSLLNLE